MAGDSVNHSSNPPPARSRTLGLAPAGFIQPVILVCGLTGTIGGTLVLLLDRGFIPHAQAIRVALGIPPDVSDSMFYELYDPTPVIDIEHPAVVELLRARMQTALARHS